MTDETKVIKLAKASTHTGVPFGESFGSFYMPQSAIDSTLQSLGLVPEKLIIPKDYHSVIGLCYNFYQRGGIVSVVVNRLSELAITSIRNGQRKTTNEANMYFEAVLHRKPSRLMRFLFNLSMEYYLSGMLLPRVDWTEIKGREISSDLPPSKSFMMPVFDWYPPSLVHTVWADWGEKEYYLKVPAEDVRLIRRGGSKVKEQQLKYQFWVTKYPDFVDQIKAGSDMILIKDVDPILRKETSFWAYPTPLLFNVLEPLIYKQQLRRMDFSVASRIINAILLVKEGNDSYPLTEETRENLDELKAQILARSNNPRLMERLFILFSNHTTTMEWITPDVSALLNQEKYIQTNDEIQEGLGFSRILITGETRSASAAEVSTWAIQPQMEQLRIMLTEWMTDLYEKAADLNKFKNVPKPIFKPIRLQDIIKTAAVFQAAFSEGNVSRTSRADSIGLDFETEVELMKDEKTLMEGMPQFPAMPYSPPPPITGGRPIGSQNVPINNRNSGVKPRGQKPASQVRSAQAETTPLLSDQEVIHLIDRVAKDLGISVTTDEQADE